ncbi:hypothetical protein GCM10020001_035080 [Nonomuraea salmonea]
MEKIVHLSEPSKTIAGPCSQSVSALRLSVENPLASPNETAFAVVTAERVCHPS